MNLENKTAFITGASSGIGEAIARRFASAGAAVAVSASSSLEKAKTVSDQVQGAGGTAWPCVVDVSNPKALLETIEAAEEALGPIDILVNSAGLYYATPIGETDERSYDRMVDTNLKGTFFAINTLVPKMRQRGSGKIVNIASVAAVTGVGTFSLYCATKAGISMMTKALARELAPANININAIAPGNTATPMNEEMRNDPEYKEYIDAMAAMTPSTHTFSNPEEIAELALFLASDSARAMHGETVVMDEGISTGIG